jgi:hypothetical protein
MSPRRQRQEREEGSEQALPLGHPRYALRSQRMQCKKSGRRETSPGPESQQKQRREEETARQQVERGVDQVPWRRRCAEELGIKHV